MNGVSAAVLATGNDTRAIEAGAHVYATHEAEFTGLFPAMRKMQTATLLQP